MVYLHLIPLFVFLQAKMATTLNSLKNYSQNQPMVYIFGSFCPLSGDLLELQKCFLNAEFDLLSWVADSET